MKYPDDFIDKIICGDCFDIMPGIPDKSIDCVITDMPYNITACKWDQKPIDLDKLWIELKRIGKDNCGYVFTASQPFTTDLICSNRKWFKYEWIWEKDNSSNFMLLKKQPGKRHENILIFYDQCVYNPQMKEGNLSHPVGNIGYIQRKREYIGIKNFSIMKARIDKMKYPTSVIKYNACGRGLAIHPTQKPVALMEYLIKTYTNEGDLVCDPFIGSGTTAVACINTNRSFIGIELDIEYCKIAENRIEKARQAIELEKRQLLFENAAGD